MFNKKGQSLVEVLVSLTILMIVFSSVVGLVTVSSRLNLSSRTRTKASALAQKALTAARAKYEFGNPTEVSPYPDTEGVETLSFDNLTDLEIPSTELEGMDLLVTLSPLDGELDNGDSHLNSDNFMRLTAKVSWKDAGVDQEYKLVEVVKK